MLASWYLAEAQNPAPPRMIPQPAGGGDRNAIPLYDFPRQRIVHHFIKEMPLRVSALRTLGAYSNVFAIESFLDELARAANADPIAFRLARMKDPRARAVIEAVAKKANWKEDEAGDGRRGRGIGFAKYKTLSVYIAVIAEVEVDPASGVIKVPRAFAVADAGQIILTRTGSPIRLRAASSSRRAGLCMSRFASTATGSPRVIGKAIRS